MKRRTFLTIAGVSGTVASLAALKIFSISFEEAAQQLITKQLHYLKLDEIGVRTFVREYSTTRNRNYKQAIKAYNFLNIEASQSGKVHQLLTHYLLSSDFFIHKMDESRVIKYAGLYNPYIRPCTHPAPAL